MLTGSQTKVGKEKYVSGQSVNLLSSSHSHISASYLPELQKPLIAMFRESCSRFGELPFMSFRSGLSTTIPEKADEDEQQSQSQEEEKPLQPFSSLSYTKVERMVNHIAAAFQYLGVKKGDTVGLMAINSPLWLISDLAIMARGAITVPIATISNHDKLAHIILHSGMRLILTQKQFVARILGVSHRCDNLKLVISLDTLPKNSSLLNTASLVFGILEQNHLTTAIIDQLLYEDIMFSKDGSPTITVLTSSFKTNQPERSSTSPQSDCSTSGSVRHEFREPATMAIDGFSYLNEIRDKKISTQASLEDRLGAYYIRDGRTFTCFSSKKYTTCLAPFPPVINQSSTRHSRRSFEQAVDKSLLDISSYLRTHVSDTNNLEGCLSSTNMSLSQSLLAMSFGTVDAVIEAANSHQKTSVSGASYLLEEEDALNIISLDILLQKTKRIKYTAADDTEVTIDDLCGILYKTQKKGSTASSELSIIGMGITYEAFISSMTSLSIGYLPGHMRFPDEPYTHQLSFIADQIIPGDEKISTSRKESKKESNEGWFGKGFKESPGPRGSPVNLSHAFASRGTGPKTFTADVTIQGTHPMRPGVSAMQQPSFLSHLPLFMPIQRVLEHVAYIRGYQIYYSSGVDRNLIYDLRDSKCTLFIGTSQMYQSIYKAILLFLSKININEIDRVEKDMEKRAEKLDSLCQESMFLDLVGVDQLTAGPFGPLTVNLNVELRTADYVAPLSPIKDPQALAIQKVFAHSHRALVAGSRIVPERISNDDCNRILRTFTLFEDPRLLPYCKSSETHLKKHWRTANAFLAPILRTNGRLSQSLMVSLKTLFYQSRLSTVKMPLGLRFINESIFGGRTTHFLSIGGPLSQKVHNFFRIGTSGVFSSIYGVSEFLGVGCYTYYHDLSSYGSLLGRAMPGISCIVVDAYKSCKFSLEKHGIGELCLKGKSAVIGSYLGSDHFREMVKLFKSYCHSFTVADLGALKILKKKIKHIGLFKSAHSMERLDHLIMVLLHLLNSHTIFDDTITSNPLKSQKGQSSSAISVSTTLDCNLSSAPTLYESHTHSINSSGSMHGKLSKDMTQGNGLQRNSSPTSDGQGASEFSISSIAKRQATQNINNYSSMSMDDLQINPALVSSTASSARQSLTISELKQCRIENQASRNVRASGYLPIQSGVIPISITNSLPASPSRLNQELDTSLRSVLKYPDIQDVSDNSSSESVTPSVVTDVDTIMLRRSQPVVPTEDESSAPDPFLSSYSKRFVSAPLFSGSFADQERKQRKQFTTNELFDADGYLHTGDLVKILPDGRLLFLCSLHKQLMLNGHALDRELADRIVEEIPYITTCCLCAKPEASHTVAILNCQSNLLAVKFKESKIRTKGNGQQEHATGNSIRDCSSGKDSDDDEAIVEKGVESTIPTITATISAKLSSDDGLLCERYGKNEDDLTRVFLPLVVSSAFDKTLAQMVEEMVVTDISSALKNAGLRGHYAPKKVKIYIDREMHLNRVLYTHSGRKNYRQFEYVFKTDIRSLYESGS